MHKASRFVFNLVTLTFLSSPVMAETTKKVEVPAAYSKKKVTLIGDSHTALAFGDRFYQELTKAFDVHLLAASSSKPKHWSTDTYYTPSKNGASEYLFGSGIKKTCQNNKNSGTCKNGEKKYGPDGQCCIPTEKLTDILKKDKPDFIIIALGANLSGATPEVIKVELDVLVAQLDDTPCFWVAPPYSSAARLEQQAEVYKFLSENKALRKKCLVYDSRKKTNGVDAADGTHYSADQSVVSDWAIDAATEFLAFAKINMNKTAAAP